MVRVLRAFLIFLFILNTVLFLHYVTQAPIWSPIDEIAHYDYIDRLSTGQIPLPADRISDYTADLTIHYFEWIHNPEYQETKESMGQAGYSYEAQQPPLYYTLLAPANWLIKTFHAGAELQIKALRLMTAGLVILGAAAGGLVVYRLQNLLNFHSLWAWFFAVALLLPHWDWRSALNNGNLSLLVVNLAFYFTLGSLEEHTQRQRNATLALLCGVLAFLTKYTNLLVLVIVMLILASRVIWEWRKTRTTPSTAGILAVCWPLALVPMYFGFNLLRFGWADPFGSNSVTALFSDVTILVWGMKFFQVLIDSAYYIPFLSMRLPVVPLVVGGMLATAIFTLEKLLHGAYRTAITWLVVLGMVILLAFSAWVLPKVQPTVDWANFRHYSGYQLPVLLAIFGALMQPCKWEKYILFVFTGLLAVPAIDYFW